MTALDIDQLADFRTPGQLGPGLNVTLPLAEPVKVDGRRYQALTFRPASRHDVRRAERGASGKSLVARLAGVRIEVIHALAGPDIDRAAAVVEAQFKRLNLQ